MKPLICKYLFIKALKHQAYETLFYIKRIIRLNNKSIVIYSIIGSEESVVFYELHICVKDSCFGRDDKLIGVSVMQLKDIQNQGNLYK